MGVQYDAARAGEASELPKAALALGVAGLAPFVACLVVALLAGEGAAGAARVGLQAYGACILSFMGGVHWGLAIHPAASNATLVRLGISTGPALTAWAALLLPPSSGLLGLALAFAALLAYDLYETGRGRAPGWYPRLRIPLTLIVMLCLLLASLA